VALIGNNLTGCGRHGYGSLATWKHPARAFAALLALAIAGTGAGPAAGAGAAAGTGAAAGAGTAAGAALQIEAAWPAQYDTSTGAEAFSTVPAICANKGDPTLAAGGPLLEIGTNLNYGQWPASGQSDQSFPEGLANFFGKRIDPLVQLGRRRGPTPL
jgi:hypothetical protein